MYTYIHTNIHTHTRTHTHTILRKIQDCVLERSRTTSAICAYVYIGNLSLPFLPLRSHEHSTITQPGCGVTQANEAAGIAINHLWWVNVHTSEVSTPVRNKEQ